MVYSREATGWWCAYLYASLGILFHPLRLFPQSFLLEHSHFLVEVCSAGGGEALVKIPGGCRGTYAERPIIQRSS